MYAGPLATFIFAVVSTMATGDDRWMLLVLPGALVFGGLQRLIRCPNCGYALARMGTLPSGPLIAPKRCGRCSHDLNR
jgi:hypothetical protein